MDTVGQDFEMSKRCYMCQQDGVIDISDAAADAPSEAGTSSPTAADSLASGYYRCGGDRLTDHKVQTHGQQGRLSTNRFQMPDSSPNLLRRLLTVSEVGSLSHP